MAIWNKREDEGAAERAAAPGISDLHAMDVETLMNDPAFAAAAVPHITTAEVTAVGDVVTNEHLGEVYPITVTVDAPDGDPFEVETAVVATTALPSVGDQLQVTYKQHDPGAVAVIGPA